MTDSLVALWDNLIMVINDKSNRTFGRQKGYYDTLRTQVPTVIPVGGKLDRDLVRGANIRRHKDHDHIVPLFPRIIGCEVARK